MYKPHALQQSFLDKFWFGHLWVHSKTVIPVIPTPLELEVAQMIRKPACKTKQLANAATTKINKKNRRARHSKHTCKLDYLQWNYGQKKISAFSRPWHRTFQPQTCSRAIEGPSRNILASIFSKSVHFGGSIHRRTKPRTDPCVMP